MSQTVAENVPAVATPSAPQQPFVGPLLVQLGFAHAVLHTNLAGITHEESLRSPMPGGNCLNWVVGHLVHARNTFLTLIGGQPIWDAAAGALYSRGSAALGVDSPALPFAQLVATFDAAQEPLARALAGLTAEQLAAKAPFSPRKDPDETIGSLMALFATHEAYHVGQTGLLRRLLGLQGAIA